MNEKYQSRAERRATEAANLGGVDEDVSKKGVMNWIRGHKKTSAAIGAGTIAGLAGGAVLVGNILRGPGDGPTPEQTTTSEPTEPTASPTPTETETPVDPSEAYNYNIDKATVDALVAGGQEALLQKPLEERMVVALYYAQEELPQVAADFHRVSKDSNDLLPPGGMSKESSFKDVAAFVFQMQNVMFTRPASDGYFMDDTTAKAIGAGLYVEGSDSVGYANSVSYIDAFVEQQQTDEVNRRGVDDGVSLAITGIRIPEVVEDSIVKGGTEDNPTWTFQTVSGSTVMFVWKISTAGPGMWVQANG